MTMRLVNAADIFSDSMTAKAIEIAKDMREHTDGEANGSVVMAIGILFGDYINNHTSTLSEESVSAVVGIILATTRAAIKANTENTLTKLVVPMTEDVFNFYGFHVRHQQQ